MAVHLVGLLAIIFFYVLILAVGCWASRKSKQTGDNVDSEDVMLAGRNIGVVVGMFTMTGMMTSCLLNETSVSLWACSP